MLKETHGPARLKNSAAASELYNALSQLQGAANRTSLEPELLDLIKIRASQINRCAFCLELHTRVASASGVTAERLHLLPAWEEVDAYSARERAALRWTEAVTQLAEAAVSDHVFAEVSEHFSETELVELTFEIIAVNSWNRLNVAFRNPPNPSFWPGGKPPQVTGTRGASRPAAAAETLVQA